MMWERGSGGTVLSYSFLSGDQTHLPPGFPRVWQAGIEPVRRGGGNHALLLSFRHPLWITVSTAARNMTLRRNCKDFSLIAGFLVDILDQVRFFAVGIVLCILGYLAASLASTQYSPVPPTPVPTTPNISRYCQMSSGGQPCPQFRTTAELLKTCFGQWNKSASDSVSVSRPDF